MAKFKNYFNLSDIKRVYEKLNYGSTVGVTQFADKAKYLATMVRGKYLFKDEVALFELFQREVPELLERWKIRCWNELVQFMD